MLFNSFDFAVFFAAVYVVYRLLDRRGQNRLLVLAGCVFYGWWDWRFLSLLYLTAAIDYAVGLALGRTSDPAGRRRLLAVSVAANLTVLGFFKYFNFFLENFERVGRLVGLPAVTEPWHILLPVGISFYTFVSMSYSFDVYRRRIEPARDFVDYAAFVTFFPQLLAGPITAAAKLLTQIRADRRVGVDALHEGAFLVAWGLFKKIFVADNLARIVEPVFAPGAAVSGAEVALGAYAFAFQIYCDFSGYTDIARGLAKWMGIELELNFRLPYWAGDPSDFWKRWHASLSNWLKDYLYIPLGGNRSGGAAAARNVMITMLLGGLWHGANWTFVLWGGYHGVLLCLYRWAGPRVGRLVPRPSGPWRAAVSAGRVVLLFHLVCLGWLLFRSPSVWQALRMAGALVTSWTPERPDEFWLEVSRFLFHVWPVWLVETFQWSRKNPSCVLEAPAPVRVAVYVLIFYALVVFGVNDAQSFLYFQF